MHKFLAAKYLPNLEESRVAAAEEVAIVNELAGDIYG